jgi:diguanylate cyclase (GGDEF)-like protein
MAIGSVSAAFVLDEVLKHTSGHSLAVITNLAYPVTDLVLLGACATLLAVRGWRLDRTVTLLAAGVTVFWIADSLYLVETARGTYTPGGVFDEGWWLGLTLIALAAWQPGVTAEGSELSERRRWIIVIPVSCAAVAAGVLAYGDLLSQSLNDGAIGLALGALAAVAVRLIITFRTSLVLLGTLRSESLTDALTGLPNRRALIRALEEHTLHLSRRPAVLALYDLDGFKRYNDAFGHQAGDALLARLGGALRAAIGRRGTGYRMGGDEFCVLLDGALDDPSAVLEAIAVALTEHGEGFSVTSSWGAVSLPEEADSCASALRIADQRMYAQKNGGRPSASRQSTDVLLRALAERHPALDDHAYDVAALAELTASRLGCTQDDVEQIRLAAELHDVGKVAIPAAILNKPGPLDEEEWEYIGRHTLIGERIVAAAPSLQRVARMVRSSHERHDGRGYPDGLSAEAIPLGARVIAVCDAYDAMVAPRPYSPAMRAPDAMAELWRCAGAQFDPAVVAAFAEALSSAVAELAAVTRA